MTAALLAEQRISLTDLAERENVHISTVARWCARGIKGYRLESFSVGWKKFTTLPAYERWLTKINAEDLATV
jgi:transposase